MDTKIQKSLPDGLAFEFHTYIHRDRGLIKHFHKNFELIIPLNGICKCTVNDQSFTLSEGECIFLFPFQTHSFDLSGDGAVRRIIFNDHLILTAAQSMKGMIPKNPVFRPDADIRSLILKLMLESFGEDSGQISRITPSEMRMKIKGLLYFFVGDFLPTATLVPAPKTDIAAMDIALYISENYKTNVTLKDIAKQKGYNYQYLSRTFNRYMDMNFKKMLNYYRIHRAFAMLQDTNLSVSSIAIECGFKSIRSFNQVCRDVFEKTPTELRKIRNM